ncbi:methyltransferase domain-containing protein [Burkholderia perseverans]|uniref:methyltransferase domain-containing protein n=1 Tax=Burkholderia perseverans TaxID=2615214 RepID=UPI001FEE97CB|nr:methyltransferase domain-containing protein [Burkholderia perseverans]
MDDAHLARRLLLAFGAQRYLVLGVLPDLDRVVLRDAGSEVIEHDAMADGTPGPPWAPDFVASACVVCLDLSDEALTATLSGLRAARGAYIQRAADDGGAAVEHVERLAFALGYRKHPAYHRLFGYAALEQISGECATLLEPVPAAAAERFPMARLIEERDLHMDMLREAGRRSDAHVVRYDWAARFIRPNDVVLDAACGLGYGTYVMRYLSPAGRCHGIDGSDWAVDYASACFPHTDIDYTAGLLPAALDRLDDASIDVVVSFETLEHVAHPEVLLAAFHRVLRPGGRIIVSVPNDWSDETGEDPNPYHLHVYTYARLAREMAAHFTIEQSVRQIASGCKRIDAPGQWVEHARALDAVEPADAPHTEAEWWLVVAMKLPATGREIPYRETVHGRFEGGTHLVDFEAHYENPWLMHAMVEIPFRLQRADALERFAESVCAGHPLDTADYGAALAVLCYRALEARADDARLAALDARIAAYLAVPAGNPHVRRWHVSLTYVRARLCLRRGDRAGALADFSTVASFDVGPITPTLGTKVVSAAFLAGVLSWSDEAKDDARGWWRLGLTQAGHLLGSAWSEFFGNLDAPFIFAMNDAVEIVDRATACAQALAISHRRGDASAAALYDINQQTLRSALCQREADLASARAETAALRGEFERVCRELAAKDTVSAEFERLSAERLARLGELETCLRETRDSLLDAQRLALESEADREVRARYADPLRGPDQRHPVVPEIFAESRSRLPSSYNPYRTSTPMTKKTCVFTSAALNYIPKVRLLFRSLRELHPEIELHLALSDVLAEDVDLSSEPFDAVHPLSTLDIPDVQGWAFCHNIVELSTAIKPFLLKKLLEREDVERVLYFDPDMVLFSRVDDLLEALDEANVILTPHQIEPETRLQSIIDNEICSLKHGVYNLGFVGVSASAEGLRFAEWWKQRIYHFCRADIPNGLFTDQRWIDLVPAFFSDVAIVRSPRHNVAPWNLTTRSITGGFADGFKVNGEPLGFYHFTGFDSGAHRTMAAINSQVGSQAGVLIDWYETQTAHLASDPLTTKNWAYGAYTNGEKIQPIHRLIYRERVDLQRAFPDPFDVSGTSFHDWVREQGPHEYPGIDGGAPSEALLRLKQQLTAGFAPRSPDNLHWRGIVRLIEDAAGSPERAGHYVRRAWEILRQQGISGIKRRLT